jgi:type IV fimbrial biogenesis protein FimT
LEYQEIAKFKMISRMNVHTQRAFSLVEMLVVISILAILSSLAIPAFDNILMTNRLRSYANTFLASVNLARSESLKRNAPIIMCVSTDGVTCGSGAWHLGWIITTGATVISHQQAFNQNYEINEASGLSSLSFSPSGIGATLANISVCRVLPKAGNQERVVRVTATGKASVSKTTNGTCT